MSAGPYLTPDEAVAYLGLPSRNALKQRMKRKTIPAWCWTRMGGKSLRFVRAALDEWLQPKERVAALRLVHGQDSTPIESRRVPISLAPQRNCGGSR